jgi:hypothetical protein
MHAFVGSRNKFGLFRRYYTPHLPIHDPAENVAFGDMVDASTKNQSTPSQCSPLYPYPNMSSFLLGEWFWDGGSKKSKGDFKKLVDIVGHPDFRPEDIAAAKWNRIAALLSGETVAPTHGKEGDLWEAQQKDKGWVTTPVSITVPFQKKASIPGPMEYAIGALRHRKLVSVIKEKFTRPASHHHLHYEPYQLYWQPNEARGPIRVHGELYASEAFIDAHREAQELPREPGCSLPRVVAALMFASDGTQLTSFSNAKLWPVYLAFGNESKERRSKALFHAYEHVAYFESVSCRPYLLRHSIHIVFI